MEKERLAWYGAIIAVVFLVLVAAALSSSVRSGERPPLVWRVISALGRGDIGTGRPPEQANNLDVSQAAIGDLVFGGNPGCSYGRFSHVGIYVGEGKVVDMYISRGVFLRNISSYRRYSWAAIARVKAPPDVRLAAAQYAASKVGQPFYTFASRKDDGLWYCSKLVWLAYLNQGIDLDEWNEPWVVPDSLYESPYLEILTTSGGGEGW